VSCMNLCIEAGCTSWEGARVAGQVAVLHACTGAQLACNDGVRFYVHAHICIEQVLGRIVAPTAV